MHPWGIFKPHADTMIVLSSVRSFHSQIVVAKDLSNFIFEFYHQGSNIGLLDHSKVHKKFMEKKRILALIRFWRKVSS